MILLAHPREEAGAQKSLAARPYTNTYRLRAPSYSANVCSLVDVILARDSEYSWVSCMNMLRLITRLHPVVVRPLDRTGRGRAGADYRKLVTSVYE